MFSGTTYTDKMFTFKQVSNKGATYNEVFNKSTYNKVFSRAT